MTLLNIITPCIRPENLHTISKSINIPRENYRWIVVFDMDELPDDAHIPKNCEVYLHRDPNSVAGHSQRNFAINLIKEGYVYSNDDDTVIHPNLWENIKDLNHDFIMFLQEDRNGNIRLTGEIETGKIDNHNFIVKYDIIGDIRYDIFNYSADGSFAISCFKKATTNITINKVLSTYNKLENLLFYTNRKIAVVLHLYYLDLWEELSSKIDQISDLCDVYITMCRDNPDILTMRSHILTKYPKAKIFSLDNRGQDVAPFLYVFNNIKNLDYDYIVKLHTKKSITSAPFGEQWRKDLCDAILKNRVIFDHIINYMNEEKDVYIAGSKKWYSDPIQDAGARAPEIQNIKKYSELLGISGDGGFISGTTFIARFSYMKNLLSKVDLNVLYNDFESGYKKGGTVAHAFERLFGYGVKSLGGSFLLID